MRSAIRSAGSHAAVQWATEERCSRGRAALLEQVRHIAARLGRRALVKLRADLTGEVAYKLVPPCAYASATTDVHQRTALNRLCRPALKIGTVSTAVRGRPSSASSSASAGTHPYGPVSLARRQRWALGGRRRRTKCLGLALQLEIKGLALAVGRHRHREDRQNVCELHLQRRRVVSSRQRPTSSARLRAQRFPREIHTLCKRTHTHTHACGHAPPCAVRVDTRPIRTQMGATQNARSNPRRRIHAHTIVPPPLPRLPPAATPTHAMSTN